ncbi:MAG: nuclease-related domain-containing protein [Candidatus Deferrimicrobiaceae bacterium]
MKSCLEKKTNTATDRAKDADKGASAEEKVGKILDSLLEGNFIIHDFNSGRGNIDHVLVSPKGIFTLETKSRGGEITFNGEKLLQNGRPFPKDFISQAWAECHVVRDILAAWRIATPVAEPVILFSNAFVKVRGKAKGVEIISLKYLPKFLGCLPDRLTIPEAGRIYNRIKAASKPN